MISFWRRRKRRTNGLSCEGRGEHPYSDPIMEFRDLWQLRWKQMKQTKQYWEYKMSEKGWYGRIFNFCGIQSWFLVSTCRCRQASSCLRIVRNGLGIIVTLWIVGNGFGIIVTLGIVRNGLAFFGRLTRYQHTMSYSRYEKVTIRIGEVKANGRPMARMATRCLGCMVGLGDRMQS